MKKVILTGDRPTGRLHVGHYVGSLSERSQESETRFIQIVMPRRLLITQSTRRRFVRILSR